MHVMLLLLLVQMSLSSLKQTVMSYSPTFNIDTLTLWWPLLRQRWIHYVGGSLQARQGVALAESTPQLPLPATTLMTRHNSLILAS